MTIDAQLDEPIDPTNGDLFAVRLDGTNLIRLTHNGFEDGTPAWGPTLEPKPSTKGHEGTEPED